MDLTFQNDNSKYNHIKAIGGYQTACNGEEQATIYVLYCGICKKIKNTIFVEDNKMQNEAKQIIYCDKVDKWNHKRVYLFYELYGETFKEFSAEELKKSINKVTKMRLCERKQIKLKNEDDD